ATSRPRNGFRRVNARLLKGDHAIDSVELDNRRVAARVSSPLFIGRRDELSRVEETIEETTDGKPAVVLVAGEAGVGKTRFVQELIARTRSEGVEVLVGGCIELGSEGLPFAPIAEALRGLAGSRSSR